MSSGQHERRLRRLESLLPPAELIERLYAEAEATLQATACADRIAAGAATTEDFKAWLMPRLDQERSKLVDGLVAAHHHFLQHTDQWLLDPLDTSQPLVAPTMTHPTSGDPSAIARALVATPPADEFPAHLYDELVAVAGQRPETVEEVDKTAVGFPLSGDWQQANVLLLVLGEDRGASLRACAADRMRATIVKAETERRDWQQQIIAGTDRWVLLLIWFQNHKERLQAEIEPLAAARRHAREAGQSLPVDTVQDQVAEMLSYPPDEDPPPHVYYSYNITKNTSPGPDPEARYRWVEAHKWRQVLPHHIGRNNYIYEWELRCAAGRNATAGSST
jgi:hypothetical protein